MKLSCEKQKILKVISYNVKYPYFGFVTARKLSEAYLEYRNNEFGEGVPLMVGDIDGNVICNALWHEMSFNPLRFGYTSPFMINGRNNIYAFCSGRIHFPESACGGVLAAVRHKLIDYMRMNSLPNGQWCCRMPTNNGTVIIKEGSRVYAMLARLRDSIKIITKRNVADFKDVDGPYHVGICNAVAALEQRRTGVASESDSDMADAQEDRMDRYVELLDSIIDYPADYDERLYSQALAEKEAVCRLHSGRHR